MTTPIINSIDGRACIYRMYSNNNDNNSIALSHLTFECGVGKSDLHEAKGPRLFCYASSSGSSRSFG